MLTTTLTRIRQHSPCAGGWRKLVRHLGPDWGEDKPIALTTILDSNGLGDAIWALRACDNGPAVAAKFAAWCATRAARHAATHAAYATYVATSAADDAALAADAYVAYDAARAGADDALASADVATAAERALQAEHLRSLVG